MLTCKTTKTADFPASESSWITTSSVSTSETLASGTGFTEVGSTTAGRGELGTLAHSLLFQSQFTTSFTHWDFALTNQSAGETIVETVNKSTFSTSISLPGVSWSSASHVELRQTSGGTLTTTDAPFTTITTFPGTTIGSSASSSSSSADSKTISYHTTATQTLTSQINVTTLGSNVTFHTTSTNATTSKTTAIGVSSDTAAGNVGLSTVTRTQHISGTSTVAQPTFGSPPANYNATTVCTAAFADEDEMLYVLTASGVANSGLPSALLTASVASLIADNQSETHSTHVGGFAVKTVTNTTNDSAGSVTHTRLNTQSLTSPFHTFSRVKIVTASTLLDLIEITRSDTSSSPAWFTTTSTLTYVDGFQSTLQGRGAQFNAEESYLAVYNETTALDARTAAWSRFARFFSEVTTTQSDLASSSQFTATENVSTATGDFTFTRERTSTINAQLREVETVHDRRTRARYFPQAGAFALFGTQGFVVHPNSRASSDSSYVQLSGDTRDFTAHLSVYKSLRPGIAMPAMGVPSAVSSTTVSFNSAQNSVYETIDPGSSTDTYPLLAGSSSEIVAGNAIFSSSQSWSLHPISNIGGPGSPPWPVAMSVEDGMAYTLRDSAAGETTSHFTHISQDTTLSVPASQEIFLEPSAYWTRNNGGPGYTSARVEL